MCVNHVFAITLLLRSCCGSESQAGSIDNSLHVYFFCLHDRSKTFAGRLMKTLSGEFFVQFLWSLPWCVLVNASPYCLNKIIEYIECTDCRAPTSANYMWVFGLLFASIFESLAMQAALHKGRRIYVHTVSICNAQVFAKTLRRKDMAAPAENTDEDGKEKKEEDKKKDGSANISSKYTVVFVESAFKRHPLTN